VAGRIGGNQIYAKGLDALLLFGGGEKVETGLRKGKRGAARLSGWGRQKIGRQKGGNLVKGGCANSLLGRGGSIGGKETVSDRDKGWFLH